MTSLKKGYRIVLILLIALSAAFVYLVVASPLGTHSRLAEVIQTLGIFVALLAAVIALAAADPKRKSVKVGIEVSADEDHVGTYERHELSDDLKKDYKDFPSPLKSHRVQFKITNVAGFTLEKPTLTFRLPLQKQHPHIVPGQVCRKRTFHSNLFNSQQELRSLEFADTRILSNSNLPYWNDGDQMTIWIRMILDDGKLNPFNVELSVNSANADGITEKVEIKPKALIKSVDLGAD
jgi:hypothetical protein